MPVPHHGVISRMLAAKPVSGAVFVALLTAAFREACANQLAVQVFPWRDIWP